MVFYGAVSKGCYRCRRRKCDQRKPGCLRCEKAKTHCPGYRNLADVIFRDESERVIERARLLNGESQNESHCSVSKQKSLFATFATPISPASTAPDSEPTIASVPNSPPLASSLSSTISQPINELGAHFFFNNYLFDGSPYSGEYHPWLTQTYCDEPVNEPVRACVEAVGMAIVSNILRDSRVGARSKRQYGLAIAATNRALSDPVKAVEDTTLASVILLGIFETITSQALDQYSAWAAHIKGATALLQLRGASQFDSERGAQLWIHLRSQIGCASMQQGIPVPSALIQLSERFTASPIGQRRRRVHPSSIAEISFRLLNLRAAVNNGEITDRTFIHESAREIDMDLMMWRAHLGSSWDFKTVDVGEGMSTKSFYGRQHIHIMPLAANIWNMWRALRVMANKLIFQTEDSSSIRKVTSQASVISAIRQLSTDICISTCTFTGSPYAVCFIWPLFIVSQEGLNNMRERCWALEQLRHINDIMGIRQAGSMAEDAAQTMQGVLEELIA